MNSLVWFRRDLRIVDNPALYNACQNHSGGVIGLYVLTPDQWKSHDDADCKIAFWLANLKSLSADLANRNIPLQIECWPNFNEVPTRIVDFMRQHECGRLFFNREYEVNESNRDAVVQDACQAEQVEVHSFDDRVIVPPQFLKTGAGKFYSVFTPYRRAWDKKVEEFAATLPAPCPARPLAIAPSDVPQEIEGFDLTSWRQDLWPAGETEAKARLEGFGDRLMQYHVDRDLPAVKGTSLLSPYLAAGVISPRQCLAAANNRLDQEGARTWVSELTWRDFYTQVLVACPRVSRHRPFKQKTDSLTWRDDKNDLQAWQQGMTGFPIVDAGMRQLNRTGWMHNRLRMVTAMFFAKNLFLDWRLGERYFMRRLIDGDLAANNGGWQWSASTGTDAVPYFRIFNPFSQSKRFDAQGTFIKKMCPELEPVPATALHDPVKLSREIKQRKLDYPPFVVDYKASRERVLTAFKSLG